MDYSDEEYVWAMKMQRRKSLQHAPESPLIPFEP